MNEGLANAGSDRSEAHHSDARGRPEAGKERARINGPRQLYFRREGLTWVKAEGWPATHTLSVSHSSRRDAPMGVVTRMPLPGSRQRQGDSAAYAARRGSPLRADPDDAPRGPDNRRERWAIIVGLMITVFLILVLLYIVVPSPSADTGARDNSMEILRYLFGR